MQCVDLSLNVSIGAAAGRLCHTHNAEYAI